MQEFSDSRVIVFGGTTEGRILAEKLYQHKKLICVCVATEYGESFLSHKEVVRVGRMDGAEMKEFFQEKNPTLVIDATHPYATEVTRNIKEACEHCSVSYVRVEREQEDYELENSYSFTDLSAMIDWVNEEEGIVFSTLGVKEVEALTAISDYQNRLFVRVLPVDSSLELCDAAGIERSHVIAEKGPFSYEQNVAMLQSTKAGILLTKDSGKAGGYAEKVRAAKDCQVKLGILVRPEELEGVNSYSMQSLLDWMKQ